jgi:hypothetical protein
LVFAAGLELVVFFALEPLALELQVVFAVVSCSCKSPGWNTVFLPHFHFILFPKKRKNFLIFLPNLLKLTRFVMRNSPLTLSSKLQFFPI